MPWPQLNYHRWHHATVRDLAWVIASPTLLSSTACENNYPVTDRWCREQYFKSITWLDALDRDTKTLDMWLLQRPAAPLGRYFESLVGFWIQHMTHSSHMQSNLVVYTPPDTLGEFDFLFFDPAQQQNMHWEVAVKFYLFHHENNGTWLGPNPKDDLASKTKKLFTQQILLSRNPHAQTLLHEHQFTGEIRPQILMKGYLFYPLDVNTVESSDHALLSPDHLQGWWCHASAAPHALTLCDKHKKWQVLDRLQWLAPVVDRNGSELLGLEDILNSITKHFEQNTQPLLISEVRPDAHYWREYSRGFIVHDQWPTINS